MVDQNLDVVSSECCWVLPTPGYTSELQKEPKCTKHMFSHRHMAAKRAQRIWSHGVAHAVPLSSHESEPVDG